jgi:acyl-CoA-dependent ceramide synthase
MVVPRSREYTSKFVTLAYRNSHTGDYGVGIDDSYFIAFCIVLLTGLRAATMEHVLAPFAKYLGVSSRKDIVRFSEQGWLFVYCTCVWSTGMVSIPSVEIISRDPNV